MIKIITTSAEDFVKAEIDEHGFDYVDAQFALGYEPMRVSGIWCWVHLNDVSQSSTLGHLAHFKTPIPETGHKSPERVIRRN